LTHFLHDSRQKRAVFLTNLSLQSTSYFNQIGLFFMSYILFFYYLIAPIGFFHFGISIDFQHFTNVLKL